MHISALYAWHANDCDSRSEHLYASRKLLRNATLSLNCMNIFATHSTSSAFKLWSKTEFFNWFNDGTKERSGASWCLVDAEPSRQHVLEAFYKTDRVSRASIDCEYIQKRAHDALFLCIFYGNRGRFSNNNYQWSPAPDVAGSHVRNIFLSSGQLKKLNSRWTACFIFDRQEFGDKTQLSLKLLRTTNCSICWPLNWTFSAGTTLRATANAMSRMTATGQVPTHTGNSVMKISIMGVEYCSQDLRTASV